MVIGCWVCQVTPTKQLAQLVSKMAKCSCSVTCFAILFAIFLALDVIFLGATIGLGKLCALWERYNFARSKHRIYNPNPSGKQGVVVV